MIASSQLFNATTVPDINSSDIDDKSGITDCISSASEKPMKIR